MSIIKNTNKEISANGMPTIILCICSILLFIRCFFSFTWSDESFYLSIVHRLWLGELMFVDEWYTTQLSAPLLIPFYAIYQRITGGNEGIYLYYRFLYCLFSAATAFLAYFKLKKWNGSLAAFLCSLIYLFYSRANIGGLSYYNTTLTLVLIGILLIYEQLMEGGLRKCSLFIVGVVFALAVVITPYLAIPYIAIAVFFLLFKRTQKYWKYILMAASGTMVTAIIYLCYVLSKVNIGDVLFNVPYVLNEPELQKTNPVFAIPLIFIRIAWRYRFTILPYAGVILYICYKHLKNQSFTSKEIKCIWIINILIFVVNFIQSANLIGCINIAFVLFGILLIVFYKEWNCKSTKIVQSFGVGGLSIVFSFTFSSDTGLDAMSIGFVILAMGMLLLIFQNHNIQENKSLYRVIVVVIIGIIIQTAFLRMVSVYRDAPLNELNTQISSGPAKYLYTTEEHAEQYYDLRDDIMNYVREDDRVIYSKNCFWSYLCTENEYGVPTSWRIGMDSPRLEEYYTLNPQKLPTCVFVLKPEYGKFESSLIQNNEKTDRPNENNLEGFLYEYMMENDYEVIDSKSSLIFRKRNLGQD